MSKLVKCCANSVQSGRVIPACLSRYRLHVLEPLTFYRAPCPTYIAGSHGHWQPHCPQATRGMHLGRNWHVTVPFTGTIGTVIKPLLKCNYIMHVRMYACTHACMYAYTYACIHACAHACTHACMHVRMHVCMYVSMYACLHACIRACIMHANVHACNHAIMHACNHAFMHA